MSVLLLGAGGLVGNNILRYWENIGFNDFTCLNRSTIVHPNYQNIDISNRSELTEFLLNNERKTIINAVAYTHVDGCESDQVNADYYNFEIPKIIAEICCKKSIKFIHISSDYIYDGKNGPYSETDLENPLSYYAKSKLQGDLAILNSNLKDYLIFRAIVIYGYHSNVQKLNFVTWLIRELRHERPVNIVTDQFSTFTYAADLAKVINQNLFNRKSGIYNICGNEFMSRYQFSVKIAELLKLKKELIQPIKTINLNQKAIRPLKSGLMIEKAFAELSFRPTDLTLAIKEIEKNL